MVDKIKPRLIGNFGIFWFFTLNRRVISVITQFGFGQIFRRSSAQNPILKAAGMDSEIVHKIKGTRHILNSHEFIKEAPEDYFRKLV